MSGCLLGRTRVFSAPFSTMAERFHELARLGVSSSGRVVHTGMAAYWLQSLALPPSFLAPCLMITTRSVPGQAATPRVNVNLPGDTHGTAPLDLAEVLLATISLLTVDADKYTLVRSRPASQPAA